MRDFRLAPLLLLWVLAVLLGTVSCGVLTYSGDGCADYEVQHAVSTTLDLDVESLKDSMGDPSQDPDTLSFALFGQQFWKQDGLGNGKYKVYFTSGGYVVLQICSFETQFGVQIEIIDSTNYDSQDDLSGSIITIKFLPESWYGNRVVLSVGFSLGSSYSDKDHTTNILWSYVYSFIHHAQAMFGAYPCDYEFSTGSGYCNNMGKHTWGATNQPMRRLHYKDPDPRWLEEKNGVPIDTSRPSARKVSNDLLHQPQNQKTSSGVNMLWVTFGQFVDHDLTLNPAHKQSHPVHKSYNIPVDSGDEYFFEQANSANCKHEKDFIGEGVDEEVAEAVNDGNRCKYSYIAFSRSEKCSHKGVPLDPPVQYNAQTAFLDLSQVYGNSGAKIKFLRAFKGGWLKTGKGNTLPYNGKDGVGLNVAVEAENDQTHGVAGDIRGNEQPYLTAMHIVWLREHNRIATELANLFPGWKDERLFQEARKIAVAEYQGIVYNEWLPFLLGAGSLGPYNGYRQCVNPSASVFFSTCAFRFGHSMVTENLKACDYNLKEIFEKPIEKTLFQTELWEDPNVNVDSLILGGYKLMAEENDAKIQNALRNHLFSHVHDGTASGFDLAAANIQRCRDHACPSWSAARRNFRLRTPRSWRQLRRYLQDPDDAQKVLKTYGIKNLDNLDAFPVALMEIKEPGALVGPLFHRAISDQFWRLREGDRFHYQNIDPSCEVMREYRRIRDVLAGRVTLKDIFVRNFNSAGEPSKARQLNDKIRSNMFLSPEHGECDPPLQILQATPLNDRGPRCKRPIGRTVRYFWDKNLESAQAFKICNVHGDLVNNLKGFRTARAAQNHCAHLQTLDVVQCKADAEIQ